MFGYHRSHWMKTKLLIAPGCEELLRANGLTDFDAFMRRPGCGPAPSIHWNRETVPLDLNVAGQSRRFFLKRLFRMQPEHVAGALLRGRRPAPQPVNEWHNISRLEAAGIRCARRIAMGERSRCGIPRQGFLRLAPVPAPLSIAAWLSRDPDNVQARRPRDAVDHLGAWMRRRLLFEAGALCRRLDDLGLFWYDLDPKHIH